ncbi:MAG TPA: LacI family DNA-binding transcriptional regulator [Acidobacteriota bacterium]|nr:LacI family DNA-binding transcriptional regulator [Acidobacteriota bacterium]
MAASIKTIAEKAGVSASTVSRALRDDPRISPETKKLVQSLAHELGYTPSQVARSLVLKRTHTVGVVVTTVADPYVSQVMAGVETVAHGEGYALILATSGGVPERELQAVEILRRHRVDALIIASSRAGDLYAELMSELQEPLVVINAEAHGPNSVSVRSDTELGARLATRHLLDLGHRRIAFLGGPAASHSSTQRRNGYLAALQEAGVRPDHRLLLPGAGEAADGRRALPWLLDLGATGVVCYNDLSALGLLAAAAADGVAVPETLSVVGIDNMPFGVLSHPPLTTVDQQVAELGRQAMKAALAAAAGEQVNDRVLESRLILRGSTGKARPMDESENL